MRKLATFIIFLTCYSPRLFAQTFLVSKVIGTIYYNSKTIIKGDHITGLEKLSAGSSNASLRVVSASTGSIPISFAHGKKIIKTGNVDKSEIYELVVQDYIDKYTTYKSTQTKAVDTAPFDWVYFFYEYPENALDRKMLIVDGEKIPMQSASFNTSKHFNVYADIYSPKKDTMRKTLSVLRDSLTFTKEIFPLNVPLEFDICIGYNDAPNKTKILKVSKRPIQATCLSVQQLDDLIRLFQEGWKQNYKDASDAKKDFYSFLKFNYDKFYQPLIDERINKVFQ